MNRPIITLTTDFGLEDSYAAEMKGALLRGVPHASLIDVTHLISPFDIHAGAFQLLRCHHHFPKGTYHIVIVDPGVGSKRRSLFVQTDDYFFVGPDNGVLSWAIQSQRKKGKAVRLFEIATPSSSSVTFHGRDVFAPLVAHHAQGNSKGLGEIRDMVTLELPELTALSKETLASVIHIDRYGNLITNIPLELKPKGLLKGKKKIDIYSCYEAIAPRELGLIRGSHGFWEIAAHKKSAAKILRCMRGARFKIGL